MDLDVEMHNRTIISLIEERLPDEILNEWIAIAANELNTESNKFILLLELLLDVRKRIEYQLAKIRTSVYDNKSNNESSSVNRKSQNEQRAAYKHGLVNTCSVTNVSRNSTKSPMQSGYMQGQSRCWLHPNKEEHPIWKCLLLHDMSVSDRLVAVRKHSACFSCLK